MSDEKERALDGVEEALNSALAEAQLIQDRLQRGEEVDERELEVLARTVAEQLEEARARMESLVGPIDRDEMRRRLKETLSPEEYEDYLANEQAMLEFREQYAREKSIRDQMSPPQD